MLSVSELLDSLGLGQYAPTFAENDVDLKTLAILSNDDLKELGIPFGPRKRILHALLATQQPETVATAEERRHLTVLFCDMVGFTERAQRIDTEVLQDIIRSYEDACAACVARYDGYVFQRLGDGIIAFFGYPLAHEREAERAIRAGLEIVEAMTRIDIPDTKKLEVRIGIATGIVVVSPDGRNAVGETMNLAARLQGVAAPGNVVVSPSVRRLAGHELECEDLGEHALKGIAGPSRIFRARGFNPAQKDRTPLIGRAREMDILLERWNAIQAKGAGQLVALRGEPGIGKSGVASAFAAYLESNGFQTLRFQCSPFHLNSAFYPVVAHLEAELDLRRDEPADSKLNKLEALFSVTSGLPREDVRFVAAMMSIPFQERYGPLEISPRLAKLETMRVLAAMVKAAAFSNPCLLLLEDAHWADPTTLDILDLWVKQLPGIPQLALVTYRPEFEPRWPDEGYVTTLDIARLTAENSQEIISRVAGGKSLPAEIVGQIIARTDGVPLFVEELTRTIIESGDLIVAGDRYVYSGASLGISIPETLRDSLTARLDRLLKAKRPAQIGAVIGRSFSYELLAALEELDEANLDEGLTQLTASGLATCEGIKPQANYVFRHALIQDVAYESLLKSHRRPLHAKLARLLEERSPDMRNREPEVLAQHYDAAGDAETAVPLWLRAGEVAMQRFAVPEAVTHLRKGLNLIEALPPAPARDIAELQLRAALGPALVAQRGWGHPELETVLEPAWSLARSLQHHKGYLPILHALWVHAMCVDRLAASLVWAQNLLVTGEETGDDSLVIVGHRAASASSFWLGDFIAAREHGDLLHAMHDSQRHWHIAQVTNNDPLTGEGVYRSQYLWMLGYPDQAVAASDAKDDHARRRNHPFDLAFALTLGAQVFDFLGEPEKLLRRTDEADSIGRKYGVALLWEVMAEISRGIAALRAGRHDESIACLDRGITRLAATGHRIWIAYLRALQAETMALTGELEAAAARLDESLARIAAGEEKAHYAEVLRLKGWVLMRQKKWDEAERTLRAAISVAQDQQAKSWELRSATTLAQLLIDSGRRGQARDLLSGIYGWFSEGFATKDLQSAKALLNTLQTEGDSKT